MDNRIKRIADTYGLNSQLDILQEECAELVQAVSKYRRGQGISGVIEEIVDVQIMLEQIIYLIYGQPESTSINCWREEKLDRQIKRIEESKNDT